MKTKYFSLAMMVLLLLQSATIRAQWLHTNGPYGGSVQTLTFWGTDLLAGSNTGGVFRSSDNGTTWLPINGGLPNKEVTAIAAKGGVIVLGTSRSGVFVPSEAQVDGWQVANQGLTNQKITALAINDRNDIFAATDGGGVFRSTDGAMSWQVVNNGMANANVTALCVNGSNLYAGYATNGVSLSTDNGASWKYIGSGLPSPYGRINCLYVKGTNLYAGVGLSGNNPKTGLYVSSNNGSTWEKINGNWPGDQAVMTIIANSDHLIVGGGFGIRYSTDNGATWRDAAGAGFVAVNALAIGPLGLYAGTPNGVFLITSETSVTPVNSGMNGGIVRAFAMKGGVLYAGQNGGGVFKSLDRGASWSALNGGLRPADINAVCVLDTILLAASHNGIYVFHPDFQYWPESGIEGNPCCTQCLLVNGARVYAGTLGGVYVSLSRGQGWSILGLADKNVYGLACSGTTLLAATGSGLFISTNSGSSWSSAGLTGMYVTCAAFMGSLIFAGTEGSGVYLSADNGLSWTGIKADRQMVTHVHALAVHDTILYAGALDGVYVYSRAGARWKGSSAGLTERSVYSFIIMGYDLYAGTNDGVWRRPLSEMTTNVTYFAAAQQPEFTLSQNYPNPFNPVTTIRFSLPRAAEVSLVVYNELGEKIVDLVEGKMAAGTHQAVWDAASCAGGDYFCRLKADNFITTRKLVLLR